MSNNNTNKTTYEISNTGTSPSFYNQKRYKNHSQQQQQLGSSPSSSSSSPQLSQSPNKRTKNLDLNEKSSTHERRDSMTMMNIARADSHDNDCATVPACEPSVDHQQHYHVSLFKKNTT